MGPNERKLEQVDSAQPGEVHSAAGQWKTAAAGLEKVVSQLNKAKGGIADAWTGDDSDAATAAFSHLAGRVQDVHTRMSEGRQALDDAATSLSKAKTAYQNLPPVLPEPNPLPSGKQVSPQDEVTHLKLQGQHAQSVNQRESQAGTAYKALVSGLNDASTKLSSAAPESAGRGEGGHGSGGSGSGAGSVSGGGGTGGGSVGPYATGTGGSYVGGGVGGGGAPAPGTPVLGGVAGGAVGATGAAGAVMRRGGKQGPGPSADGVVGGQIPGGDVSAPAASAGGAVSGGAGGATGGVAGG
ncbi:MAG: WXG100 family type VII secretion target, partial [Streptosporangiaceae bacterium]